MWSGDPAPREEPTDWGFDSHQGHFLGELGHVVAETGTLGSQAERERGRTPSGRNLGPVRWVFYEAENKGSLVGGWGAKEGVRLREAAG